MMNDVFIYLVYTRAEYVDRFVKALVLQIMNPQFTWKSKNKSN